MSGKDRYDIFGLNIAFMAIIFLTVGLAVNSFPLQIIAPIMGTISCLIMWRDEIKQRISPKVRN